MEKTTKSHSGATGLHNIERHDQGQHLGGEPSRIPRGHPVDKARKLRAMKKSLNLLPNLTRQAVSEDALDLKT